MEKTIKTIHYNWSGLEEWGFYEDYSLGEKGVESMSIHYPKGEGDKFYVKVLFSDGREEVVFNIIKIITLP